MLERWKCLNELVSIIVPVYNVKKYLERCIKSIINQTYKNIEIIIVDDGSNDGSEVLCDYFKEIDQRISVIHKKNGGLSDARNAGIEVTRGKYISFVDSDDYIHSQMIEILYMAIKDTNCNIAFCDILRTSKVEEEQHKLNCNDINFKVLTKKDNYGSLYSIKNNCFIVATNKLYNKNLYENIRYPLGKQYEDLFIAHELIEKSPDLVYIDECLYYYYQRNDSIMGKGITLKSLHMLEAYMKILDFYYKQNDFYLYTLNFRQYKYRLVQFEIELICNKKQLSKKDFEDYFSFYKDQVYDRGSNMDIKIYNKLADRIFARFPNIYLRLKQIKARVH